MEEFTEVIETDYVPEFDTSFDVLEESVPEFTPGQTEQPAEEPQEDINFLEEIYNILNSENEEIENIEEDIISGESDIESDNSSLENDSSYTEVLLINDELEIHDYYSQILYEEVLALETKVDEDNDFLHKSINDYNVSEGILFSIFCICLFSVFFKLIKEAVWRWR